MADPYLQQQRPAKSPEASPERGLISKVPTGLGAEPVNLVVLGASYAGLAVAHHFLDNTIKQLRVHKSAPNYRLVLISPSTHMYWNIGAPRALIDEGLIQHKLDKEGKEGGGLFMPIEEGFHRHRGHNFSIIQGEAIALDTSARTVKVELIGKTAQKRASQVSKRASWMLDLQGAPAPQEDMKVQTIHYHALIMATGTSAHSDLLSLHGPHLNTLGALNGFHAKVQSAKSIVVCGGGCSGVETAGQLATLLNYSSHFPVKKHVKHPKKIILITGSDRCLPKLEPEKVGKKAEEMLKKMGVIVRHGVRVIAAKEGFDLTGQTKVELNDDTNLIVDMYISCTGVFPNSGYAPSALRDTKGYIRCSSSTLRCDETITAPRVYAIGDCAKYSQNQIHDVYDAVPVLMHNLLNDLLAYEYRLASPGGGGQGRVDDLQDELYARPRDRKSQLLIPIGRFGGVGVIGGRAVPGFVVYLLKGRDYGVGKMKKVVNGANPYAMM